MCCEGENRRRCFGFRPAGCMHLQQQQRESVSSSNSTSPTFCQDTNCACLLLHSRPIVMTLPALTPSRPITGRLISLTGWGVDALEDATTAAVDLGASAVGWGMTQTLPGPVLDSLANKILPSAWSSKLGLLRPCSVEPAVVQQQAVETGSSNGGVVNAPSITTPAQQQMQLQRRAVVVPAHGSVSA